MNSIFVSIIAVIPGLLIAFFIYRMDKFEKESPLHLLISFVLGMLATIPSMYMEEIGARLGWETSDNMGLIFLFAVLVVGFSEEITKYIALLAYPFPSRFFNEPLDGIIYAVMIAMGFATVENLMYADRFGLETILIRAFTAVPVHAVLAVFCGYYMGLAKFNPQKRWKYLALALVYPVFLHGLYDFFIIQESYEWLMVFATLTLYISAYFSWQLIKKHQNISPFKGNDIATVDTITPTPPVEPIPDTYNDITDAVIDEMEGE